MQMTEKKRKDFVDKHPATLTSISSLAFIWRSLGLEKDAFDLLGNCSRLQQKVLGPDHPDFVLLFETLKSWQQEEPRKQRPKIWKDVLRKLKRYRIMCLAMVIVYGGKIMHNLGIRSSKRNRNELVQRPKNNDISRVA